MMRRLRTPASDTRWRRGRLPRTALVVTFAVLALTAGASSARAQARPVEIGQIKVGFDGYARVGFWTPLWITLTGGSENVQGQVVVTLADGDGVRTRYWAADGNPVLVTKGRTTRVLAYVKFGQMSPSLDVALISEGKTVASRSFDEDDEETFARILPSSRELFVQIGASIGLSEALRIRDRDANYGQEAVVAEVASDDLLPNRWYGYEGVDAVAIATGNPARITALTTGGSQGDALVRWVTLGGRVLLCVGKEAPTVLAPESDLARLVPGKLAPGGMMELRDAAPLEDFAAKKAESPEKVPSSDANPLRLNSPRLIDVEGQVLLPTDPKQQDHPLIVRAPFHFGEVTLVTLDLDLPPLSRWADRPKLVDKLFGLSAKVIAGQDNGPQSFNPYFGHADLAAQLRDGMDEFEGVTLIPFWLVAVLVFFYILLIGPGDYFFVKKVLRRMELTWVTFPAIVISVSVLAYGLAYWLKGSNLRINQVDVVDVDVGPDETLVRGTAWVNLFSPRTDQYNLSLAPQPVGTATFNGPQQVIMSWLGLPGEGLGAMGRSGGGSSLLDAYGFSPDLSTIEDLPVAVWSTKSVTARWDGRLDRSPLNADLKVDSRNSLSGTLTSRLGTPLRDCVLLYGGFVYDLNDIKPEQSVDLGGFSQTPYKAFLQGSSPTGGNYNYEPSGDDVPRIVRGMLFHRLAERANKTDLLSRYQSHVDLSHLVDDGRAVLLGQAPKGTAAAQLTDDGQPLVSDGDRHWTFYRFVLRVEQEGNNEP